MTNKEKPSKKGNYDFMSCRFHHQQYMFPGNINIINVLRAILSNYLTTYKAEQKENK